MVFRQATLSIALLVGLFLIAGCDQSYPESTQTLEVSTHQVEGGNIRLLSITSTKRYFNEKQAEVRPQLETVINSGEHNIASVKTSYSSGYLTAAQVIYDSSGRGDGNNTRVMFIHSDEYYWNNKAAEIQPQLDEVVNSGRYDVVKINTTYAQGYLLAAEVYYRTKEQ